jgi:two-component system, OmpR family, sensor kinase
MGLLARLPIRVRLTLAFAVAMAIVLAGLGFLLYTRMESSLDGAVERTLRGRADDVAALVRLGGIGLPQDSEGLSKKGQTFAQVLDESANVVDSTAELREPLLTEADVARIKNGPFFVDRPVPGSDEIGRLFVVPVDLDGLKRVVVVGESLEAKGDALESLLTLLLIGGPLLLVLSSAGAYVLAGRALRPVNELLGRVEAALARERRFVSDASHELRTPLAALRVELELALRRKRTQAELEDALRSAMEEANRLSQLAEDLLVLARAEGSELPVRREQLVAAEVLGGVRERYARRATEADRSFEVRVDDGLALDADRLRVEQALGNLVENALRHGRGRILLEARSSNGRVELHVQDEGDGFPPGFLESAFEPFARSDPSRSSQGAGLGLAIVDVIARAHGGAAHAANVAGGADVWLVLPR